MIYPSFIFLKDEVSIRRNIKNGWVRGSDGIWSRDLTPEENKRLEADRIAWLKANRKLKVVK